MAMLRLHLLQNWSGYSDSGHATHKTQLDPLWHTYRPEIAKVTWAASPGDRSERADVRQQHRVERPRAGITDI